MYKISVITHIGGFIRVRLIIFFYLEFHQRWQLDAQLHYTLQIRCMFCRSPKNKRWGFLTFWRHSEMNSSWKYRTLLKYKLFHLLSGLISLTFGRLVKSGNCSFANGELFVITTNHKQSYMHCFGFDEVNLIHKKPDFGIS